MALVFTACAEDGGAPTPAPGDSSPPSATEASRSGESSAPTGLTPATVSRVVDGDTIEVVIGGQSYKLRYIGIDTPESVDPRRPVGCLGKEAAERNRAMVEGATVGLEKDVSETDDFGRLLRYVWLDGEMVNALLVEEGYAEAATYPPDVKYSEMFASLQAEARNLGRGLWGPICDTTAASPVGPIPPAGACEYSLAPEPLIKGNLSIRDSEKIYHVPGGEYYEATVIDPAAGERWFCTEAEAVAAGWRRSLR